MSLSRNVLFASTMISAVIFAGMTVDTMHQISTRTHADQLSAQVVEGKRLWQERDCNDCHTILGIGGYYAPDVTKSYGIRGQAWLKQFLKNPEAMYPGMRQMPNFRLTDTQIESLVAFLKWVSEIDTNGWPPAPRVIAEQETEGHRIFVAQHCNSCHSIQGVGGTIAPDLTHEGSRHDADSILRQIGPIPEVTIRIPSCRASPK